MANYYFLATLLPQLKVGTVADIGSRELDFLLRENLTQEDFEKVTILRRLVDIENIRAILQKQTIEPGGNLDQNELEECLLYREGFPSYVLDFLEQNQEPGDMIKNFTRLLQSYFTIERKTEDQFLSQYLTFEWQWRLVFVALRAKDLKRPFATEFQYEDPDDTFVSAILSEGDSVNFDPPAPYEGLKVLYEARKGSPLDLYQALSEWRFNRIEEMTEWEFFSIERILGYVAELEICEKWLELDKRKGLEIVEEMMEVV